MRYLSFLQEANGWPEELYILESGSWLSWVNDTAAHYVAIHCPALLNNWTHGLQQANQPHFAFTA